MMMKKLIVAVSLILAVGIFSAVAVPIFAADPGGSVQTTDQNMNRFGRAVLLAKLLLIQDQAKVDQLLATAVANNKLTADQAAKIETFWDDHHAQFTKRVVLRNLLRIQDEGQLNSLLSQAVSDGKITRDQANRITVAWEKIHNK
jgi:hypothetical protein